MWTKINTNKFNLCPDFDEADEGEEFVQRLISNGKHMEIVNVKNADQFKVPDYYDREMFKR